MAKTDELQAKIKKLEQALQAANNNLTLAVSKQTADLAEQADFFRILYDITISLNRTDNVENVLGKIIRSIQEMLNAKAVTVRLLDDNQKMRLVASAGINTENLNTLKEISIDHCLCEEAIQKKTVVQKMKRCDCAQAGFKQGEDLDIIVIPIRHKNKVLGMYNAFLDPNSPPISKYFNQLLSNIGINIGTVLEKLNIEQQKHEHVIHEERLKIAHEIHDSLAQTVASLKLRLEIMEKSVLKNDHKNTVNTLLRIKHGINQANLEIRELIRNFRAPNDLQSLRQSIQSLTRQFQNENTSNIFLQYQCKTLPFNLEIKTHIYRIVQEALTNVSKHSQAPFVRIMADTDDNIFKLLIEDDGKGFNPAKTKTEKGKHVGTKIMYERANYIGAQLSIESEPNEGCRVKLSLPIPTNDDNNTLPK